MTREVGRARHRAIERTMTSHGALGARLREARKRLRLSQSGVARFLGTTRQTVAAFEHGNRQPGLPDLVGLANLYRLTLDELMHTAESALRATPVPAFQARFNDTPDLVEHDRNELALFSAYLAQRPATTPLTFERKPFEAVAETAQRWSEAVKVGRTVPVQIFAMLARCGIEVRFTSLEELAGALIPGHGGRPHGVLVNADQPYERQRYSAAHEAGHLVLGHEMPPDGAFVSPLGRRTDPVELHADQFAAELLIPRDLLRRETQQLPDALIPEQVFRLARAFMVSYQAMTTRLVKLGALSPTDGSNAARERPSDIAKRLGLTGTRGTAHFRDAWLPSLAANLPQGWHKRATAETVRLLQEAAFQNYAQRVPDHERADDPGAVYEAIATWVARKYPIVAA